MFENPFNKMFGASAASENAKSQEEVLKMTEEQRESALDHLELLKHGGSIKLTPEEAKAHEEMEHLKNLQNEA